TMTYFETDMPVTNAYTESINRLAKDKNREGRGYSFEVMRARMLYTTKHKKKAPTAKVSPFYKKTIGYGLPDFAEELNYGVDLSTILGWYQIDGVKVPHQPLNPYTQNNKDQDEAALGFHTSTTSLSSFVLLIRFEASAVGGRICVAGT